MFYQYNNVGLLWLLIAYGTGLGLQSFGILIDEKGDNYIEVMVCLITLFDLCYRFVRGKRELAEGGCSPNILKDVGSHWLFGYEFGGSLMFLPAYMTAILIYFLFVFHGEIISLLT
jgi:hypothetical protein